MAACVPSTGGLGGVDVTLGDVPTVIHARWSSVNAETGSVTAHFGDDAITATEPTPTTDHDLLLVGIPAYTDVAVDVVSGDEHATATITTGALPAWVPDVRWSADAPDAAAGGFTLAPVFTVEGSGVVVFDGAGRAVWAADRAEDNVGAVTRARLSRDGTALLYNANASALDEDGYVVRLPLDGGPPTLTAMPGLHTDFVELPDGRFAALGWELHTLDDGRTISSDVLQEFDGDGVARTVWRVWDDFRPDPGALFEDRYPGDPDIADWSHTNSLFYDEDQGDYYVTMTWDDGVARVHRETGELVWTLAGQGGDFHNSGEGRVAWRPHTVQTTDGGLLVFNRGDPRDPTSCSEATDVGIDEAEGAAWRSDAFTSERCMLVTFLGSAQRLDDGNTVVSWSAAGQMDEYAPDGRLAWRVATDMGAGFGFALRVPSL
jgi:hypothetical protein